jgi:hypothetical protein
MDDLLTRAELVGYDPGLATVGTVVPRAEFDAAAARGEFPATLFLDLDRVEPEAGHARVAVDWDQDTLDQLLATTDDDEIALWFDERELARAFDEVEAHGLRERAAMLAIAATAAGVAATPALARTVPSSVPMGIQKAQEITPGGGGGQSQTPAPQRPAVQITGANRGETLNKELGGGRPSSRPGIEVPAVTSTGDSGLTSGELAAIAGAGAILISAAGFGIATRRHGPPAQPA